MPRQRLFSCMAISTTAAFLLISIMASKPAQAFDLFSVFHKKTPPPVIHYKPKDKYLHQARELDRDIQKMARQLFANLEEPDPQVGELADGIVMGSFVDLKKLTRTTSFGRYLAEQLMTEFQHRGYRVVELRKSTSIIIQEKRGEYGLSRDVTQINQGVPARTMVTGTYTIAGDMIMVNAKVLDNKDANLLSSATLFFPKNALTDVMLSDAVSASPPNNGVTYMKKLEL